MSMLENIVAATDLSAASRHAADRAAQLARAHDASLTLVHALASTALDDLRRWVGEGPHSQAIEDDARERLRVLAGEVRQRHGARVDERLVPGRPVQAITDLAEQLDAGLLVTGTRGAGFFRGIVVGSTAERIANRSSRPVLMVRQSVHEAYRRVLVPVDFSPSSLAALRLADRVAPEATVVLMHAVEVPFEGRLRLAGVDGRTIEHYRRLARADAQQKLQQLAALAGLPPQRLLLSMPEGGDPWMSIVQEEQERDSDLIVIGRQGRHAVDELLLGSTTRRVLAECSTDVLVSIQRDENPSS
jgi:nucleotide-binding universal stress UspA family protein